MNDRVSVRISLPAAVRRLLVLCSLSLGQLYGCGDAALPSVSIGGNPADSQRAGSLRISTTTTGADRDADGYTARVFWGDWSTEVVVQPTGTVTLDVPPRSDYFVVLSGVAPNCIAQHLIGVGATMRRFDAVGGAVSDVKFEIACEPKPVRRLSPGTQLAFVREGRIHLINSDGTGVVRLTDGPADCMPAWSPDGTRIAFVRPCSYPAGDIHVMNANGSSITRRTRGGYNTDPTWSPDGKRIAFSGDLNLYTISADDDGFSASAVVDRPGRDEQPAWSPDGRRIAFSSDWVAFDLTSDIFVARLDSSRIVQLTNGFGTNGSLVEYYSPTWSPNGTQLAVVRCLIGYDTCGASTLAVMRADGTGLTPLASMRGSAKPAWSPDGRTIAFSSAGVIQWIRADGSDRGIIVADGHSPAWRP